LKIGDQNQIGPCIRLHSYTRIVEVVMEQKMYTNTFSRKQVWKIRITFLMFWYSWIYWVEQAARGTKYSLRECSEFLRPGVQTATTTSGRWNDFEFLRRSKCLTIYIGALKVKMASGCFTINVTKAV